MDTETTTSTVYYGASQHGTPDKPLWTPYAMLDGEEIDTPVVFFPDAARAAFVAFRAVIDAPECANAKMVREDQAQWHVVA